MTNVRVVVHPEVIQIAELYLRQEFFRNFVEAGLHRVNEAQLVPESLVEASIVIPPHEDDLVEQLREGTHDAVGFFELRRQVSGRLLVVECRESVVIEEVAGNRQRPDVVVVTVFEEP